MAALHVSTGRHDAYNDLHAHAKRLLLHGFCVMAIARRNSFMAVLLSAALESRVPSVIDAAADY